MSDKNKTMKFLVDPEQLDSGNKEWEAVPARDEELETLVNYNLDLVDHPPHYNQGAYEAIDVIEDWGLDFHCGNAVKYISRHRSKGQPKKDIEKAVWYLQRYLERM